MTRRMRRYHKLPAIRRVPPYIPFSGVTIAPDSPDFKWPSMPEIMKYQNEYKSSTPKDSTYVE